MRKDWVQRPRLLEELARAVSAKLILVDAPAGFGKTTLVAQWRTSAVERRRFAWVSLDSGDDDPGRLWWHVVSSLERACPELDAQDLLRALRTQAPEIGDDVIPGLANRLARLRAPVVLVLDDYHVIKERSCHDQVASLLLHLPPAVQLVLITRADPRLPLARLRTAGGMVEIRMPELRFTPLQAAALVHAVFGAELTAADLADLVERTEGWPAGLYLAALSLRGYPAPGAFVRQFTGNNRFVVDFLAEEVLTRQPAEIRQFLARTSILGRFCAPLCDAVAGSGNGADILDVLERENLFVVPLDETRGWYRYHHLFAQVLRSELARAEPGTAPALHQRASAWYLASGWVEEAISHALAAGDIPGSVDLIARNWHAYVSVGRAGTVRAWMRLFTDDQIAAHPLAAHCAAWAAALSGEPEPLRRWLPVIEASHLPGQLPDGLVSLAASAALLRGVYGFEGLRVMRESARQAAGLETDPGSPWYALARAAYGFSLYLSGDLEAAEAELEDAARSEWCATLIGILALSTLSLIAVERGDIPRAEGLADRARGLATRDHLSEVAVLRLLRGTLSLREISVELYVSPNTVKTHAQAIYRKLGVSTRHDAVARGREAGVLSDLDHGET
ncbi:MAG: LuxR C-terminal-related transcriptional regulator [Streptosporangiaceae bacterium]